MSRPSHRLAASLFLSALVFSLHLAAAVGSSLPRGLGVLRGGPGVAALYRPAGFATDAVPAQPPPRWAAPPRRGTSLAGLELRPDLASPPPAPVWALPQKLGASPGDFASLPRAVSDAFWDPEDESASPNARLRTPRGGSIRLGGFLGGGLYGRVYEGTVEGSNRKVALKFEEIGRARRTEHGTPLGELEAHQKANGLSRVARLVEYFTVTAGRGRDYFVLVTELVPHELRVSGLSREQQVDTAAEVLLALAQMHSRGVAHQDIHGENLRMDSQGRVKVIDFGAASVLERGERGEERGEGGMERSSYDVQLARAWCLTGIYCDFKRLQHRVLCDVIGVRAENIGASPLFQEAAQKAGRLVDGDAEALQLRELVRAFETDHYERSMGCNWV